MLTPLSNIPWDYFVFVFFKAGYLSLKKIFYSSCDRPCIGTMDKTETN